MRLKPTLVAFLAGMLIVLTACDVSPIRGTHPSDPRIFSIDLSAFGAIPRQSIFVEIKLEPNVSGAKLTFGGGGEFQLPYVGTQLNNSIGTLRVRRGDVFLLEVILRINGESSATNLSCRISDSYNRQGDVKTKNIKPGESVKCSVNVS